MRLLCLIDLIDLIDLPACLPARLGVTCLRACAHICLAACLAGMARDTCYANHHRQTSNIHHTNKKQVAEIEKQAREQSQLTTLTTRTQNVHGCVVKPAEAVAFFRWMDGWMDE